MRTILVGRGLIGLWFGARLAALPSNAWTRMFDLLADYLIIDGVLALVVSGLFLREATISGASRERNLGLVVLVDGLGRTTSGVALHVLPGIPVFPVAAVAFIGVMAVCTAAIGFSEAALVVEEESARHGPRHSRRQLPAVPVGLASIVALAFGGAALLTVDDPILFQPLLACYVVSAAAIMFGVAWSRRRA